ncbi:MAG: nitroreductase family protein [Nanoarchaeota archaeon]|nr:nitroreductase family protein [Nanoarchaeota archaeon]
MELSKAIKQRRSVRKFKDKKPDWRKIIEAIDAMKYAPTAGNNLTLKVILVDDKEKIQKIADACQQDFVGHAGYVVVVCSDPSRLTNSYKEQGKIYNKQQIGAAIENLLLALEDAGLSTCWVGDFVEESIKRELGIPKNINVEAIFPVGYELGKITTRRIKPDVESFLYFNKWEEKHMKPLKRVNA